MLTLNAWFGYALPMRERCRLMKQAGFDGVFIYWNDDYGDLDYRTYADIARSFGLYVENIHTPFAGSNNLWLDNLDGEAKTDKLISCVEDCHMYGIPAMVVHLINGNTPPPFNDIGLNRIKRIVEKAEQTGINIALENLQRTESLAYVFDRIESDRLGFCFDSGHQNCFTPKQNVLALYGSKLMALHLHDNAGGVHLGVSDDQHKMPFNGTIDWPDVMKRIAATGYTGATTLELTSLGYEQLADRPEEFLNIAFERAKRLEAMRC
jgi:L-ribulose-5-phosphate 3-epimerase